MHDKHNLSENQTIDIVIEPRLGQLIDIEELAKLLRVGVRTIYRMRSAGQLPKPIRVGGSNRWRLSDVLRWIERGCPSTENDQQ